jgi:8-oxo-dGTP pyrophosphatase MutT (NUDIX family)
MDPEVCIRDPEAFRVRVVERLAARPNDFVEQMEFVEARREAGEAYTASAVLLPLELDPRCQEYAVILNKRSVYVQQAGDLCFPGGGTDRRMDGVLSRLLRWRLLPTERSEPFQRLLGSPPRTREIFLFVLAGVLRESWEEMRLPPWKVEYLGALPTIWMHSFPRVIFPMVGRVRPGWRPRPNWEVESLLRVPLGAFLDPTNYAICRFLVKSPAGDDGETIHDWEYPCLVVNDPAGQEILWGATFRILMNFMERVFDLPAGPIDPPRRVVKELSPYYFAGKNRSTRKG